MIRTFIRHLGPHAILIALVTLTHLGIKPSASPVEFPFELLPHH